MSLLRRSSATLMAFSLLLAGCSGGGEPSGPPKVARVSINLLASTVEVGATLQFTTLAFDAKGNALTGRTTTWSSSAATIASVDNSGIVLGVAPGSATITASIDGVPATQAVTVIPVPVALVVIDNRNPSVKQGGTLQVSAVTQDAIGRPLNGRTITWASANVAIATVSQAGLISGIASGSAYIRASSEGKSDSVLMRVKSLNAPTLVSTAPTTWTPGATVTISGTNFAADVQSNEVYINGARATVTSASASSVSVIVPSITALPCSPTGPVPVAVVVNGDSALGTANLAMATQRQLAVGESMLLTSASDILCNEFSATGGTYVVTAFNYGTTFGSAANFQMLGAARVTSASTLMAPSQLSVLPPASVPSMGPVISQAVSITDRFERGHTDALNASIALFNAHPQMKRALVARANRGPAAARSLSPSSSASAAATQAVPAVGDKLWKRMMKTFGNYNTFDSVRVRVVYVGPKLIIMEDSLSPLAGQMDAEYNKIGTEFDRDMFSFLANFGDPLVLDPFTDNNGRVIAVFSKKVNDYTTSNGGNLLGFVTSCDFALQSDPDPSNVCIPSNEGEYFYAFVPNPSGTGNGAWTLANWMHYVRGTLIHEFKHVVMFAERINRNASFAEEGWLEEATAQQATEIWARKLYSNSPQRGDIKWAAGLICDYVRPPDTRCADPVESIGHHMGFLYRHNASNESKSVINSSDIVIYGGSWSFARWVTDTYGGDEGTFLRSLVQQQNDRGINNLQLRTGKTWAEMLGYFSLATASDNYPGGAISDPRARLQSWNTRDIFAEMSARLRFSDGTAAFPRPFPLNVRVMSFGTFPDVARNVFSLPGGGFAAWEVSGTQSQPQVFAVRAVNGGIAPANVGMAVVRVK
ncbi:MAG: Ig-like domain-containing protein [Gemmatimonadaceae bacterium]